MKDFEHILIIINKKWEIMAKKEFKILPHHIKFVELYILSSNATQSYLASFEGVAYSTAKTEGAKLLTNPHIKELIACEKEVIKIKYDITKDKMIMRLLNLIERMEKDDDRGNLIKYIAEVNKIAGLYAPDKIEHSGEMGLDINITINKPNEKKD